MKFPAFAYAAPTTVEEALDVLANNEDARPVSAMVERKIRTARAQGLGIMKCARAAGCGVGTAQRVINEMERRQSPAG